MQDLGKMRRTEDSIFEMGALPPDPQGLAHWAKNEAGLIKVVEEEGEAVRNRLCTFVSGPGRRSGRSSALPYPPARYWNYSTNPADQGKKQGMPQKCRRVGFSGNPRP